MIRIILCISLMLIVYDTFCFAASSDLNSLKNQEIELLKIIVNANRANKQLLNSFDCKYTYNMMLPKEGSSLTQDVEFREINKIGRYAFSGDKVYSLESTQAYDKLHFVRNGTKMTVKSSLPEVPYNLIAIGSNEKSKLRPGTPDPWTVIDGGLCLQFDNYDEKIYGKISSVRYTEESKKKCIEVVVLQDNKMPDGSSIKQKLTALYSIEDGYLPVKCSSEVTMGESVMKGCGDVKSIRQYDIKGNTLYLPIDFIEETTNGKNIIRTMHYTIDVNSVRINPDFPEDFFTIEVQPTDQVVNKDVDVEIQGPGRRDFFVTLNENELKSDLVIQSDIMDVCNGTKLSLVYIPKGNFRMGSPNDEVGFPKNVLEKRSLEKPKRPENEGPNHSVNLSYGFYMSKYEITCKQYRCFDPRYTALKDNGNTFDNDEQPVLVSWQKAKAFCDWLSKMSSRKIRLPNEEEWEYACRAGTSTRFFWGDSEKDAGKYANIADVTFEKTMPDSSYYFEANDGKASLSNVGQYKPNNFGLYDMIGNAEEWCIDKYIENRYQIKQFDEKQLADISKYTVRGGGWFTGINESRCASRSGVEGNVDTVFVGFRILVEDN